MIDFLFIKKQKYRHYFLSVLKISIWYLFFVVFYLSGTTNKIHFSVHDKIYAKMISSPAELQKYILAKNVTGFIKNGKMYAKEVFINDNNKNFLFANGDFKLNSEEIYDFSFSNGSCIYDDCLILGDFKLHNQYSSYQTNQIRFNFDLKTCIADSKISGFYRGVDFTADKMICLGNDLYEFTSIELFNNEKHEQKKLSSKKMIIDNILKNIILEKDVYWYSSDKKNSYSVSCSFAKIGFNFFKGKVSPSFMHLKNDLVFHDKDLKVFADNGYFYHNYRFAIFDGNVKVIKDNSVMHAHAVLYDRQRKESFIFGSNSAAVLNKDFVNAAKKFNLSHYAKVPVISSQALQGSIFID